MAGLISLCRLNVRVIAFWESSVYRLSRLMNCLLCIIYKIHILLAELQALKLHKMNQTNDLSDEIPINIWLVI